MASKRKIKKPFVHSTRPAASRGKRSLTGPAANQWKISAWLLASWLLVMAGLLSLPNYNLLFYPGNPFIHSGIPVLPDNLFTHLPGALLIWGGFIAMIFLFRRIPPAGDGVEDLEKVPASIAFWFFMALGAFLRLENAHQPAGFYWDDHFVLTSDIRNILDNHVFHFMFPMGWREPFHSYLTAFLWILLPRATGHFIMLFSDTLIDLAALWIFYLAGKEIGGRRMGILLLAMGSICKTMVMVTKFTYDNETCVLAGALAVLAFLRVLKKPTWPHFLWWGLALGFGGYTYVPFRPWTPAMLGAVWLWVFNDPKERRLDFFKITLGPALLGAWAFMFLYQNNLLPGDNAIIRFLTRPVVLIPFGALLAASYAEVFWRERKKGFSKLFGWATGALVTALLMTPLYLFPHYSEHVADVMAWNKDFSGPGEGFRKVLENIQFSWGLLFGQVAHPSQIPAIGDSLYELLAAACGLLGGAYFIARPRWLSSFLASLFFLSVLTASLSNGPHSFRYVICSIPLLLTGAWGVNRLWLAFLQLKPGRAYRWAFALVLLGSLAWETGKNHRLTWEWMGQRTNTTSVWDQAEKELPNHRVYLFQHPKFYTCAMDILSDGEKIYQAGESNSIDLTPGEKGKDLAVFVWGQDVESQKKIEKEFPGIQWNKQRICLQHDDEVPYLWWAEVPFKNIPEGESGLFHVRGVPEATWLRRWYGHYGLARGMILYEDRTAHWNDQLPTKDYLDTWHSVRVVGNWNIRKGGRYRFEVRTSSVNWLLLDGKRVLYIPPQSDLVDKTSEVDLSPGVHQVELATTLAYQNQFQPIEVTAPGTGIKVPLDELVANLEEANPSGT